MGYGWIFAIAGDLRFQGPTVVVGPETKRTLDGVLEALRSVAGRVVITAGWSDKYKVTMGAGPMKDYLVSHDLPETVIDTPVASTFTTNGEAEAFTQFLEEFEAARGTSGCNCEHHYIDLVDRWHHIPRSWLLLRARLNPKFRGRYTITLYPVWSPRIWMTLYEIAAMVKNFRNLQGAF